MWKEMSGEERGGGGRVSVEEDGFEELSDYGIK